MHAQVGGGDPCRQHCEGGVRHAPPPSLARAEDGGARGDAILAILVLEAVVVVALDVLKKFRACGGATAPSFSSSAQTNGVTTTSPEGTDMAGGGRGGPVVFPHPDDDDTGCLLDDVGSMNANDDDNDDTPSPPPKRAATPRGGRGAGMTAVPYDDMTAAAASSDTVATNVTDAMNAIGPRGARDLRGAAETW